VVHSQVVVMLMESMPRDGQLQPIGVREKLIDGSIRYDLIYGLHRLEAMRALHSGGRQAAEQIFACVYPRDMSDEDCENAEVIENLLRKELSDEQRAAHVTWRLAYLEKRNGVGRGSGKPVSTSSNEAGIIVRAPEAAAQVAEELRVTKQTVNQNVTKSLKASGQSRKEFDKADAQKKLEMAEKARKAAEALEAEKRDAIAKAVKSALPAIQDVQDRFGKKAVDEVIKKIRGQLKA
jgi:ParB-like chromosome segregation protein Spo0J